MNAKDTTPAGLVDLASERLGGKALIANDEFFAEIAGADDDVRHAQIRSAKPRSMRRKVWMPNHRKKPATAMLAASPGR